MLSPTFTDAGPVLSMPRSRTGCSVTVVTTVSWSSDGVRSVGTFAVFVTVPTESVLTTRLTGPFDAPTTSVPKLQLTEVLAAFTTHGAPTLTNSVLAGMSSVHVALGTDAVPVFLMVMA